MATPRPRFSAEAWGTCNRFLVGLFDHAATGGVAAWNAAAALLYQDLFYLRHFFDQAEEGINRALGIPKRRRRR